MSNYRTVYITNNGAPATGLSPVWSMLKSLSGVDQTQPTIEEIGNGWYRFADSMTTFDHWVGIIDSTFSVINDSERYIPIDMRFSDFDGEEIKEVFITPVYDEDSDSLTLICFLTINGKVITDSLLLTSVTINVYNHSHDLVFSVNSSSFTNGIAVMTKNEPGIIANIGYYAESTFVTSNETFVTTDSFVSLQ